MTALPTGPSQTAFSLLFEGQVMGRPTVRESDVLVPSGAVLHAVEGTTRLLLIPLGDDEDGVVDEESRGVVLRPRALADADGAVQNYQTVVCQLPSLNAPFESLCDEILDAISVDPEGAIGSCRRILERWRDLLGRPTSRLLSDNGLMGLLTELHFLERLVRVGGPLTLGLWMGPAGARFDFMGSKAAVEAKATTTRDRFTVTIHGLHQLEPADGADLFLYAEQVERVPVDGDSVPEAVERLVSDGVSRHSLLGLLAGIGCLAEDMDTYRTIRFSPLGFRAHEIVDGFPRLVRSELVRPDMADRITNVQYAVDLSDPTVVPGHVVDPDNLARRLLS